MKNDTDGPLSHPSCWISGPWGKERAFSDNDVVSLLSPHFTSPVELSSDVLFCSVSDPVKLCDAGSKSGAFEKSSECIVNGSQAANGKRKSAFLLQITKAEGALCYACPLTQAP